MADADYSAISLGIFGDLDRSDGGNTKSEKASDLLGLTFGSETDPLYDQQVTLTFGDTDNSGTVEEDLGATETVTSPSGTSLLDSTIQYSVTITYATSDGLVTQSGVIVTIIQDADGNLYLVGDGTPELEDGGIVSITIDAIVEDDNPGFAIGEDRTDFLCFTSGTLIETLDGPVAVEELCVGDLVLTHDNGAQPLIWVGSFETKAKADLAPIVISAGALGNPVDLLLSPQHRVLVTGPQVELMFGVDQALIPAVSLVNGDTIYRRPGGTITYHHVMCAGHEILLAHGIWAESLFIGPQSLHSLSPAQLDEISAMFPQLLNGDTHGVGQMQPARPMLKRWEGTLLRQIDRD